MKKTTSNLLIYAILIAALAAIIVIFHHGYTEHSTLTYNSYREMIESGEISSAQIEPGTKVPTGRITLQNKDGEYYYVYVPDIDAEMKDLLEQDIDVAMTGLPHDNWFSSVVLPLILTAAICVFFMFLLYRRSAAIQQNGNAMSSFGKSHAQLASPDSRRVTFDDVAGLKEEKEDLGEIVDFLKEPERYSSLGARIPKGVLLVGAPGTGKTLLARAVAGEAGVPFYSISGSDFVEMFVGVGASRVRDLFAQAKKNAPCIIFIDEIDAVARRRSLGSVSGAHDEREQTLNQLLVEMDGFGTNEGIIVMAATNRVDILDPAILRPGRFDRKVVVSRPDVQEREEILKVHSVNKPLGSDVDLKKVARTTAGFTGADLENLMNEAAILTAREHRLFITQDDIDRSFVKVGIGQEKKSHLISEREKRITAFHETGHAILIHELPDAGEVHTISIIPTGAGAAGYTMPLPREDEMFRTKGEMAQQIIVALGGRAAEKLVFDDITTGASQDIRQATEIARSMVMKYGMSDSVGPIDYVDSDNTDELGFMAGRSYSEATATQIDREIQDIVKNAYSQAQKIINEHKDVLYRCADVLMEKEKIGTEEFNGFFSEEASAAGGTEDDNA
ncbi:MAG: ATP-dependent zinc metalloprotease FtsH [Lachnospiraceae bacterium]